MRWLTLAQREWSAVVNVTSVYMTDGIPLLDLTLIGPGERPMRPNATFHWRDYAAAVARDIQIAKE